jgi:hypothetical protein
MMRTKNMISDMLELFYLSDPTSIVKKKWCNNTTTIAKGL